jgi:hypothetical protein
MGRGRTRACPVRGLYRAAGGAVLGLADRRAAFAFLVAAQDEGLGVPESRAVVARRFGLELGQVTGIEDEGLDGGWPPLGPR